VSFRAAKTARNPLRLRSFAVVAAQDDVGERGL